MARRNRTLRKMEGSMGLLPPPPPPPPGDDRPRAYPFDLASVLDFGCPNDPAARAKAEVAARDAYERDKGVKLHPDARPSPYFPSHDSCERYCMAQQAALIAAGEDDIQRTAAQRASVAAAPTTPEPRSAPPPFPTTQTVWRN